jgi:hypothetical protein
MKQTHLDIVQGARPCPHRRFADISAQHISH